MRIVDQIEDYLSSGGERAIILSHNMEGEIGIGLIDGWYCIEADYMKHETVPPEDSFDNAMRRVLREALDTDE